MSSSRNSSGIGITRSAWKDLEHIADAAWPTETGGILLGYRKTNCLHVVGVAEVPDSDASDTAYTLHVDEAQRVLDEIRSRLPADSPIGYIGDWHVHQANSLPSQIDRGSIAQLGRKHPRKMAGIVAVRRNKEWRQFGFAATRIRCRPCPVYILDDEQ